MTIWPLPLAEACRRLFPRSSALAALPCTTTSSLPLPAARPCNQSNNQHVRPRPGYFPLCIAIAGLQVGRHMLCCTNLSASFCPRGQPCTASASALTLRPDRSMWMVPSAAGLALMLMTVTLLCWMLMPPQPQPHLDEAHLCADGQGAVALAPAHEGSATCQLLFGTARMCYCFGLQHTASLYEEMGLTVNKSAQGEAHPQCQSPGRCQ